MDQHSTDNREGHGFRPLLANLATIAVYIGTLLLSRALALPAGYATPVYLPAGVGFALAVTFGWRALPGIAIGALLSHLPDGWMAPDTAPATAAAAATVATLGSLIQAWLGALWFRRVVDPALGTARDVARFLALAPVFCLINATANVSALYRLGVVTAAERAPNWINWWAGDTVGVLLAAPLVWIVCGRPRRLWRRRARLVALPLLLAAGIVMAAYEQTVHWEHEQHLQAYRLKAQQVADELQAELREHERFVSVFARALGAEDRFMERDRFLRTASSYAEGRPDIAAVNWLVPVTNAERATFETWVRINLDAGFRGLSDLGPGFQLHPAAVREHYLPLLYTWPPANSFLRGLDFLTAPDRVDAAARATTATSPVASGPLRLIANGANGIALFRAVREPGRPLLGMVALLLDTQVFVNQAVRRAGFSGFQISLADVTPGAVPRTLAGDPSRHTGNGDYVVLLGYGGRTLQARFSPSTAYMEGERGLASWIVITTGLLLAALLGALMLIVSGERAQIEAQVADRTARLQAILDSAADAIVTVDANGQVMSANRATALLFGYQITHLPGLAFTALVPGHGGESGPDLLARLAGSRPEERQLDGLNARGEPMPLAVAVSIVDLAGERLYVCILRDLTEQQRAQARIHRLAHHDPLTGLENRHALGMRLEQQLAQARRNRQPLAVLFIDLDHFKKINDSLGHQAGDELLVGAAARMKDLLRDVDTLARLGGDEFIIVLCGPLSPDSVSAVAVRLVASLQQPYRLAGTTAHSGASVGVALYPEDGQDADTLLRHADMAMYAAKREGRGNFQFFSPAMNAATHEHLLLENRMWATLENGGFDVYLQAQVELETGSVIGAEVLLRWHDPELGSVEPGRFIPIAEESGLILPLGDWVLARAMALLAEWRDDGMDHLRLAVNLSARQFSGGALLSRLDELLAEHAIDPARMELEITETAAMRDPENTRSLLQQLRARGFKLAIDDFGTGYSSLAYLKLFAIDRIKIDRGFVRDIETNPNDAAIVDATIGLAHALGLGVIAEGVETQAQWGFLRDRNSDEAQGYLFGRPMPAPEFRDFVRARAQPVPGP
ncbi:PAS domain S-box-containing protein/diguanylate cyclase (GGDEF) domain-containing protein [Massilia sp. PDC64]|nr:EAL domain-containing protein [Massilia sp. PDC64]SDF23685.1 PAS domain S-box-containing protein/diguanylate cyclase (GGDEF) domain-containing protein [Massilia sp. PDC64]